MSYTVGISIGLSFIVFIFAYLAMNMVKEHKFVRMFFLCLCLWSMALLMGVFSQIATDNTATNLISMFDNMVIVMITVSTLFTFLFFIMGLIGAINLFRDRSINSGIDDYDSDDEERLIG